MAHIVEYVDTVGMDGTEAEIDWLLAEYSRLVQLMLPDGVTHECRRGSDSGAHQEACRELEAHGVDQYMREDAWERAL